MRIEPLNIAWSVRFDSGESRSRCERLLHEMIEPDNVVEDVISAFPNGLETMRVDRHRVGDYFKEIKVIPTGDNRTCGIVFRRKPDGGRYWKDLMVKVLHTLSSEGATVARIECPEEP